MASCGPPSPRAAATPGDAAIHAAATPLPSKDNASTSSDILAADSHAKAAAVLIPGSTSNTHEGERRCNFRSEYVPCLGLLMNLHRRFRSPDEPGQERHAACVAETASSVVCKPTTVPRL